MHFDKSTIFSPVYPSLSNVFTKLKETLELTSKHSASKPWHTKKQQNTEGKHKKKNINLLREHPRVDPGGDVELFVRWADSVVKCQGEGHRRRLLQWIPNVVTNNQRFVILHRQAFHIHVLATRREQTLTWLALNTDKNNSLPSPRLTKGQQTSIFWPHMNSRPKQMNDHWSLHLHR